MYTDTFYEQQVMCSFVFYQVECTHISGDVDNFRTLCRIPLGLQRYKNYSNELTIAKVIIKYRLPRFVWTTYKNSLTFICNLQQKIELHTVTESLHSGWVASSQLSISSVRGRPRYRSSRRT